MHAQEESLKAPTTIEDSRLVKMVNAQGREEVGTRVATTIYACGIPFNVDLSRYW
jgi:hypothetical protein